ncbi:MAG TPA: thermonuclease family protein, partial [Allosphingosinicella sp.]|nr:thermonuclease family protein [Allosphingosinicella sp.]
MHFLLALVVLASGAMPQSIYGLGRAGDGDSLRIGENRIRLHGIDAPELDQSCTRDGRAWACGQEAADQLRRLVTGRELRCDPVGTDPYGRTLARCYQRGVDINRIMVESGYAVAYRKYSDEFVAAEEGAKAAKRGIWASTFELPSVHRQEDRNAANAGATRRSAAGSPAPGPQLSGGCRIKGNHSRRREWIYHLPGMPYYNETRPEAMFCTEAEAQAAG